MKKYHLSNLCTYSPPYFPSSSKLIRSAYKIVVHFVRFKPTIVTSRTGLNSARNAEARSFSCIFPPLCCYPFPYRTAAAAVRCSQLCCFIPPSIQFINLSVRRAAAPLFPPDSSDAAHVNGRGFFQGRRRRGCNALQLFQGYFEISTSFFVAAAEESFIKGLTFFCLEIAIIVEIAGLHRKLPNKQADICHISVQVLNWP